MDKDNCNKVFRQRLKLFKHLLRETVLRNKRVENEVHRKQELVRIRGSFGILTQKGGKTKENEH